MESLSDAQALSLCTNLDEGVRQILTGASPPTLPKFRKREIGINMFGTLHCKSNNREAEFVQRPDGTSDPEKISACDQCKAKKVKCITGQDGCTRCRRLGRLCTFTSAKSKDCQSKRRSSIKCGRREHLPSPSLQPPTNSGSKDSGQEDNTYWEHHHLGSTHSINCEGSYSERDLDLSLWTELGIQSGEQDQVRDDMFNPTLSSWDFVHPDTSATSLSIIQSKASTVSENPASPSLLSAENVQRYLSSSRQFEESPPFDIGSDITTTSPHEIDSGSIASPSYKLFQESCQCSAAVIFAVERLEARCNSSTRAELDSVIAHQKEAIKSCLTMLECKDCMIKREHLVLSVFLTEKIVVACERIVVLYRMEDDDGQTALFAPASAAAKNRAFSINSENQHLSRASSSHSSGTDCMPSRLGSVTSTSPDTSWGWQELLLGDYKISSLQEWEHLIRVLIILQLRAVADLVAKMKRLKAQVLGQTQIASLARAEHRVAALEKHIHVI